MGSEQDVRDWIKGGLFTFFVGPQKSEFQVHAKAVSRKSVVFDRMINGDMIEATQRSANLLDINPEIFMRFIIFCYKDNVCQTTLRGGDENEVVCPNCAETGPDGPDRLMLFCRACINAAAPCLTSRFNGYKKTLLSRSIRTKPERELEKILEKACVPQSCWWDFVRLVRDEVVMDGLMNHACTIIFADKFLIDGLKALALARLSRDLTTYPVNLETTTGIVDVLRYVYENTEGSTSILDEPDDILRQVVVNFAWTHIDILSTSEQFMELVAEGGEFATDLLKALARQCPS